MERGHVHAAGLTGLIILAWMIIWHFLIRGVTAHHTDSPIAQGFANLS